MELQPEAGLEPVVPIDFVLNGVRFALEQNAVTRRQAVEYLRQWYPDIELINELPPQTN